MTSNTINHSSFVHLHVHSHYSIGNSVAKIKDIVQVAKNYNMPAVCLTDIFDMYGTIEFYKEAIKNGIKPIIGLEVWVTANKYNQNFPAHNLVLIAKNNTGYKNLMSLSTACNYNIPNRTLPFNELEQYSDGLIALSGGLTGAISSALLNGDREKASYIIKYYVKIFGKDNFYIELQNTGLSEQIKLLPELVSLTHEISGYNIIQEPTPHKVLNIVATNNCCCINKEDFEALEIYQKILKKNKSLNLNNNESLTNEQYFKSPAEMKTLFAEYPDAIENTVEIAKRCNVEIKFGKNYRLDFPVPEGKTAESYVRELCYKGLKENYGSNPPEEAIERLESELEVIKKLNYFTYFLKILELINQAKKNDIVFSPGYGLTASSIVAYTMHITDIDPIKYDLSFKRFMNSESFIKPKIEVEYCSSEIGLPFSIELYDSNFVNNLRVENLCFPYFKKRTFTYSAKEIGEMLCFDSNTIDNVVRPVEERESLKKDIDIAKEFQKIEVNGTEEEKKLLRLTKIIDGLVYDVYTIPNSVVFEIGNKRYRGILPSKLLGSMRDKDFETFNCSQYDRQTVEELGLPTFDFHSSDDLLFLKKIVSLIEETHENLYNQNRHLEPGSYLSLRLLYKICSATCQSKKLLGLNTEGNNYFEHGLINYSDPHVYELFQKNISFVTGRIGWWLSYLRQHKNNPSVSELEDIVPLLALDKTYPVNPEIINSYFNRKLGMEEITYLHSDLEPILKETYGIYLYEEQVIDTAQIIAGLTLRQSEKFLDFLKRKNNDEKAEMVKKFIDGAVKNGIEANIAKEILNSMNISTRRFYSKPHAVGQAVLLYRLLYLEAHYPAEFLTAELNMRMNQACHHENKKLRELEKREEFEQSKKYRNEAKTKDFSSWVGKKSILLDCEKLGVEIEFPDKIIYSTRFKTDGKKIWHYSIKKE
jgi:DNA polymerase-3 subunit alpha